MAYIGDELETFELGAEISMAQAPELTRNRIIASGLQGLDETDPAQGWQIHNFEVEEHHTYLAAGTRVHNRSTTYTLDDEGRIATLTGPDGEDIAIQGNWTPGQAYHYGHIVEVDNGDGTTTPTLTSGNFLENLSDFGRSFADAIGLDGRLGYQGTFAGHPPQMPGSSFHEEGQPAPYRVDWSGDQDEDGEPDWRDETYSNIGHWNGDRDGDGVPNYKDYNDGVGWRDNNPGGGGDTEGSGKPIILDLDGDGIEISVDRSVSFDIDADGFKEQTAWVSPDDAFLVIDLNADGSRGEGDGKINMTHELAFTEWMPTGGVTDLQALSMFDTLSDLGGNGDGVLSSIDTVWSELRVWQDANSNGIADDGELRTLASLGFTQINLTYDDGTAYDDNRNDVAVFGSTLLGTASFTRNDEVVEGGVGDVALGYNTQGWRQIETSSGYSIEFENGESLHYRVLDGSGSANVNLDVLVLDGATGDGRNNLLNAAGHSRSVQISGGDGNDSVWGGNNDDMLAGNAGSDDIRGHGGNDLLFVDAADLNNGHVSGNDGIDTLIVTGNAGVNVTLLSHQVEAAYGGEGHDILSGAGLWDDLPIYGGDGNDTITGGEANDRLSGDSGNDQINGGHGGDIILGGTGADTLNGDNGDDLILGGDQTDALNGGNGDDNLIGGAGADTLYGNNHDDVLDGGAGADVLNGGYGDDILRGGDGADSLFFWRGDDHMSGGAGNDNFYLQSDAQYGSDAHWGWTIAQGGTGFDTLYVNMSTSGYYTDSIQRIGGNQWQLLLRNSPDTKVVIDLQDIERVQYSDGRVITLSTNTSLDTSDNYQRVNPDAYLGDSAVNSGMSIHYVGNILAGWTGNDTIAGSNGTNIIDGAQGADQIAGFVGNDTLYGGGGADEMWGGDDNDSLHGGSGADAMTGGNGNDTLYGEQGADQMWGDAGNDLMIGGAGGDMLSGGSGNDELHGHDSNDNLFGGEGNDSLYGGTGSDRLNGNEGDDLLQGHQGADQITGGTGNDTLHGHDGFDVLYGDAGSDLIQGGQDDDWLFGGDGADTLEGGNGRDVLNGGEGADVLNGGDGILDVANYEGSSAAVTINLETGAASGGDAEGDTITNIENLVGSSHSDSLTGNWADNIIEGGDGADVIYGGAGHDAIDGGTWWDTIHAGDGNDIVWGGDGRDTVSLGNGNDVFFDNGQTGSNAHDNVDGGAGNDTINGGGGNDTFIGGAGDDAISGAAGNDTLTGGAGADVFQFNTNIKLGADVITDFEQGVDLLEMTGVTFGDLNFVATGSGVRVEWDGGSVKLDNINISSIAADDFTFV